jgi:hypothetical protein
MTSLQRTGPLTETDENLLVLKQLPDKVTPSRTVEVLARVGILALGSAGIIISIATLASASLH